MKKMLMALTFIAFLCSQKAQSQEGTFTHERQTRLIQILNIESEHQMLSNNDALIKALLEKQQEIEDIYKEFYHQDKNLNIEKNAYYLTTAGIILGVIALAFYNFKVGQALAKERQALITEYSDKTSMPLKELAALTAKLAAVANKLLTYETLRNIAVAGDFLWLFALSMRQSVNDANMQKLIDEYAFLEDEIRRLRGNNCLEEGICLPLNNLLMIAQS